MSSLNNFAASLLLFVIGYFLYFIQSHIEIFNYVAPQRFRNIYYSSSTGHNNTCPIEMNAKALLTSFNQELERFTQLIYSGALTESNRNINTLVRLWATFQPKIRDDVYAEKIVALGDLLLSKQCYKLAAHHCYGHFLQTIYSFSPDDISNVKAESFMTTFFINKHIEVDITIRALIGFGSSLSFHILSMDPNMQSEVTIRKVVSLLKLLQLSMQVALMKDKHCWLVFNGTVHIYSICQKFMINGLSSHVLDFLIWACVSMESSVPLITVKYLPWRSQLYTTTIHCFYDLKADTAAEEFARRGLKKVKELKEIEKMSTSETTPETTFAFNQAGLKLTVMVFKRNVFESRRKAKGVLRPKMKPMLKDIIHTQWPRTGVERMLADIFRGRAAQFLAIMEALTNTNRRLIQTSLGAPETDDVGFDVFHELLFAGMEIVSGGGGTKPPMPGKHMHQINKTTTEVSLIELASAESQLISLQSVVRFVKLAFNYEDWDTFDALIKPLISELEKYQHENKHWLSELKIMQLFSTMIAVNYAKIKKKFVMLKTDEGTEATTSLSKTYKTVHLDELLQVADVLRDISEQTNLKYYLSIHHDVLVDAVLFLWTKCKNHFSRVESSSFDAHKSTYQDVLFIKWLKILLLTQACMVKFEVAHLDPSTFTEISLKLCFILMCLTNVRSPVSERTTTQDSMRSFGNDEHNEELQSKCTTNVSSKLSLLGQHFAAAVAFLKMEYKPSALLSYAFEMLSLSLNQLNNARDERREEYVTDDSLTDHSKDDNSSKQTVMSMSVKEFHLELIYQHHYVHMLLNKLTANSNTLSQKKTHQVKQVKNNKQQLPSKSQPAEPFQHVIPSISGRSHLMKAIYLMCSVACNGSEASHQHNTATIQDHSKDDNSSKQTVMSMSVKEFHLELIYQHHYVHMLLNKLTANSNTLSQKKTHQVKQVKNNKQQLPSKSQPAEPFQHVIPSISGRSHLMKAIYLMCSVACNGSEASHQHNTATIQEAFDFLQKATTAEEKLKKDNSGDSVACQSIPPPPTLLHRGNSVLVFRPTAFQPSCGEEISYYSLFLRNAAGNKVKVRVGDTQFSGTGEMYPYSKDLTFTVSGLEPNERYMAAIGAYDSRGDLIGGSIGTSTKPILASSTLPVLLAYGYLLRAAYHAKVWSVTCAISTVLWRHFVIDDEKPKASMKSIGNDHRLKLKSLKMSNINSCSKTMHRFLAECIFISVDIATREKQLFYNSICGQLTDRKSQISRLAECEKLIIVIQLGGLLNDPKLCLQAIVHIYGLLTPIIYWLYPIQPAVEVLCHVFASLEEVLSIYNNKRRNATTDGLQLMVSCLAHYVAKALVSKEKRPAALCVLDIANKFLLQMSTIGGEPSAIGTNATTGDNNNNTGRKQSQKKSSKKNNKSKGAFNVKTTELSASVVRSEHRALETFISKIMKEVAPDSELELAGSEDAVVVNAVLSVLPALSGYREVMKFKRRALFLESFVGVLTKAFNERLYDTIFDWIRDTTTWLTKRNDIILNRWLNDAKGIVIVAQNTGDEPPKKNATGVVEYSKASFLDVHQDRNAGKVDTTISSSDKSLVMTSPTTSKKQKSASRRKKTVSAEEKRVKEATAKLQTKVPESWRLMARKRKIRNVSEDELPWRCQMNLITAECHFNVCLDKFALLCKRFGCPNLSFDENMMDMNWFSLFSIGALIVSWAGCMKKEANLRPKSVDLGGTTVDHAMHELHLVPTASRLSVAIKLDNKQSILPRITLGETSDLSKPDDGKKMFKYHLQQCYITFKRALVLAHRGCNWVLLQQASIKLLQVTSNLMMKISLFNNNIDTTMQEAPINLSKFRHFISKVFFTAADFLLDMMVDMREAMKSNGNVDAFGNIKENRGGSSLVFESLFDDNTLIDFGSVKRVILFAVEVLYYEEKWEKVCSVVTRFNTLTKNYFSETLLPVLVFSQRRLSERLEASKKPKPAIVYDQDTGVPLEVRMQPTTPVPVDVAAHIDPDGYELYRIPHDGLNYSVAPINFDDSLNQLRSVIDIKLYSARLLEHSRCLLLSYLAGKQGVKKNGGELAQESSRVTFIASQVKPPTLDPVNLKDKTFESRDDLEIYPLVTGQVPIIVSSYEQTIDMLKKTQQNELMSQAMHELGNVMYHVKNTRAAFRWWSSALDSILQIKDARSVWKKFVDREEKTVLCAKVLLERCGVWGCLLGSVVCTNLAKYILTSNIDATNDMCQLAMYFFQSLLCSTLIHPSAYHRYSRYDISHDRVIDQVIPGLNFFSDPHRVPCDSLVASMIWVAKYQIRRGFYLEVQPTLTLLQYYTSCVFQDLSTALEVKLMRIESLCELGDYSAAIRHFLYTVNGISLPKPADVIRAKVLSHMVKFNNRGPLNVGNNYQTLKFLCGVRLNSSIHGNVYGEELCQKIYLCQVRLLLSIAQLIYDLPSFNSTEESSELESREVKEASKESLHSVRSSHIRVSSAAQQKKSKEKHTPEISPVSAPSVAEIKPLPLAEMKGKLLAAAEEVLNNVLESSEENIDMESYVRIHMEFSRIEDSKFHTISAASYIHQCLLAMCESSSQGDHIEEGNLVLLDTIDDVDSQKSERFHGAIDANLWLKCRLMLSEYLHEEDNAVGRLSGPVLSLVGRVGSLQEVVENGLLECEMFNDTEISCFFKFIDIQKDLKCGKDSKQILERLRDLHSAIENFWCLTRDTMQLQFSVKVLMADLQALLAPDDVAEARTDYETIQMFLLDQLVYEGYKCSTNTMLPAYPYRNVNLKLLNHLVSVKVRLYRTTALEDAAHTDRSMDVKHWTDLINSVEACLVLIDQIPGKDTLSKLELLLLKGEIQKFLFEMDAIEMSFCIETFMNVVSLARSYTMDLSIIRQCYNEMALIFNRALKKQNKSDAPEDGVAAPVPPGKTGRRSTTTQKQNSKSGSMKQVSKEMLRLTKGAWLCIRTAGVVAKAQRRCDLIPGDPNITELSFEEETWMTIPSYVFEDLSGVERANEMKDLLGSYVLEINDSANISITWVHLLNYTTHLRRMCSYSSMALGDFDKAPVRVPLNCNRRALKLSAIVDFLNTNLSVFKKECTPILPNEIIVSLLASLFTKRISANDIPASPSYVKDFEMTYDSKSVKEKTQDEENGTSTGIPPQNSQDYSKLSPESSSSPEKLRDRSDLRFVRNPLQAGDHEIALQWFKPELSVADEKDTMYILAAMNSKPISGDSSSISFSLVASLFLVKFDQSKCFKLHDELLEMVHSAESDMAMQGTTTRSTYVFNVASTSSRSSSSQTRRPRPSTIIKPSKLDREEELKPKMLPIVTKINEFFAIKTSNDNTTEQVCQFEATLTNLLCLENMFNPSLGHISRVSESMFHWFLENFNRSSSK